MNEELKRDEEGKREVPQLGRRYLIRTESGIILDSRCEEISPSGKWFRISGVWWTLDQFTILEELRVAK